MDVAHFALCEKVLSERAPQPVSPAGHEHRVPLVAVLEALSVCTLAQVPNNTRTKEGASGESKKRRTYRFRFIRRTRVLHDLLRALEHLVREWWFLGGLNRQYSSRRTGCLDGRIRGREMRRARRNSSKPPRGRVRHPESDGMLMPVMDVGCFLSKTPAVVIGRVLVEVDVGGECMTGCGVRAASARTLPSRPPCTA
jgi:hypothetical protein